MRVADVPYWIDGYYLSPSLSLCSAHRALACPTHLPWDLVDDGKGLSPAPRHPPTDISSWVHSTFAYVRLSGCNRVLREAVSLCRIRKKFSRGDPLSTKKNKEIHSFAFKGKFIAKNYLSRHGEVQDFLKL